MDLLYICYDDTGPKGYLTITPPMLMTSRSRSQTSKFLTLMFLRVHIFQTIWWIGFIFDTTIDTGPK